ncbi:MAG: type II toxin-antitoxin system VapC family toxin [Novosphingobium sp.]|nr:type II toxin-antitoxin system VapC family toxin [Novosphingobium sp.]
MILVDSNVVIDILQRDPKWFDWSKAQIGRAALGAYLFVNPVVIGEIGWQFESVDHFRHVMASLLVGMEPLDAKAGFLAAGPFRRYHERRGDAASEARISDFLIGGHAQSVGATILTRDPRFYRTYFPEVPLITPESTS